MEIEAAAAGFVGETNHAMSGIGVDPPREWIDADTGHRVIRLSDEPGSGSFYFHQNGYAVGGDKLVFSTRQRLAMATLKIRKIEPLLEGRVSHVVVGRKTRQVFYIQDGTVYAANLDTRATRAIVKMPELRSGSGLTVNADDTVLAGSYTEGRSQLPPPGSATVPPPGGRDVSAPRPNLEVRWAARLPMALYTIQVKTGEVKFFHHSTDRSEEHTSELQSHLNLVCRLLLEKKKKL